jgi:hypothetical protein
VTKYYFMKGKKTNSNRELYNSTVFSKIYSNNEWGGLKGEFYSGTGSHNPFITGYSKMLSDFIREMNIKNIVEIGCGDFFVTNACLSILNEHAYDFNYHGYDVVKPLIEYNKRKFSTSNISFTAKDGAVGNIKHGDLLIIRQVLQHLNNKSILNIISKFKNYKYIVFTEHQISEKFENLIRPNFDKQTSATNRIQFFSGVYLEKPPFNCVLNKKMYSFPENIGSIEAYVNSYLILNN